MDSLSQGQIRSDEPPAGVILRSLNRSHTVTVREIASQCFPRPWDERDFCYFLSHPCGCAWGAFLKDTPRESLVAYCLGLLVRGDLDIVSIATEPKFRRQGLGRRLLKHLISLPEVFKVTLEVEVSNQSAIRLYEQVGFNQVSVRKKYYAGERDALFMVWGRG